MVTSGGKALLVSPSRDVDCPDPSRSPPRDVCGFVASGSPSRDVGGRVASGSPSRRRNEDGLVASVSPMRAEESKRNTS